MNNLLLYQFLRTALLKRLKSWWMWAVQGLDLIGWIEQQRKSVPEVVAMKIKVKKAELMCHRGTIIWSSQSKRSPRCKRRTLLWSLMPKSRFYEPVITMLTYYGYHCLFLLVSIYTVFWWELSGRPWNPNFVKICIHIFNYEWEHSTGSLQYLVLFLALSSFFNRKIQLQPLRVDGR